MFLSILLSLSLSLSLSGYFIMRLPLPAFPFGWNGMEWNGMNNDVIFYIFWLVLVIVV
jgi:hypothetical protein